jgi:hypothetical protein
VWPLVVSLPLASARNIIQAQWDLGFDIPNSVQVVVQVQKVSNFKGLDKSFDWDENLTLSLNCLDMSLSWMAKILWQLP